ncbi:uncharacterized protein [Clinocottus analis]|uniref:uncharacterized protein n=1 Tax=Clinocottus analis TaxID=304258 RepID=UPI0035BEDAC7
MAMNDTFNEIHYDQDYNDEVCEKDEVVKFGSVAIPVFFSVVITLSVTGNLLVLVILTMYENLKSLTNIFVLNLVISDLVFTTGLPFWAIYHIWGWLFSEVLCKIVTFVFFTGFYSSILFLTIMTIYRYLVVVHSQSNLSTLGLSTRVCVSFLLWTFSIGAAIPSLLYSSVVSIPHNGEHSLGCEYNVSLWKSIGVFQQNIFFLITFAVMAFCYVQLLRKITRTRSRRKNRAVKLVFCIVAVFFLSWVPYNVVIFLRVLADNVVAPFNDCDASINLDYAFYVCRFIAFSHCCLNPVFYAFVGVKFRSHLRSLLLRLFIRSPAEEQQVRMPNFSRESMAGVAQEMGLWILIGLNVITNVYGYSNGLVSSVCESMLPEHSRLNGPLLPAQTTVAPFDVLPEPGNEGDPITVSLKSKSQTGFQGFMLEARERISKTVIGNRPIGQFIALGQQTRLLSCYNSEGAAVSHRENQKKILIKVNWTAPGEDVNITFRATFLENFEKFWINVTKDLVFPPHTTPAPSTQQTTPTTTTTATTTTTTSTTQSSNTKSYTTVLQTTTPPQVPNTSYTLEGIAVISANSFPVVLNLGLPNIFFTVLPSGPLPHRFNKVSQISCSLLCAAVEILSVVMFCHPIQVHLLALVCVALVINFIKLVIACLPIGPSHELKEICDRAVKVCSVVHLIFTIAVVFVGVLEIENCKEYIRASWLLKMMITSTVWTFLFVIWDLISSTQRNTILGRSKIGSPQNSQRWRQQSKEKKLSGAEGIVVAVSVVFIFGSLCFAVAITVGVLGSEWCMKV